MIAWLILPSIMFVYVTLSRIVGFHLMAAPHKHRGGHHPDYVKIAQLEHDLGIGEPVYEPLPVPAMSLVEPVEPPEGRVVPKSDAKCAFCIPGRPPAHGCIFYPGCRS